MMITFIDEIESHPEGHWPKKQAEPKKIAKQRVHASSRFLLTAGCITALAAASVFASPGSANAAEQTTVYTQTTEVPLEAYATDMVLGEKTNRLYLSDLGSDAIVVLDVLENKVIDTIPVGNRPRGLALAEDKNILYVAEENSNTVSAVNLTTKKIDKTVTVGNKPVGLSLNPDQLTLYVTNSADKVVTLADFGDTTKPLKNIHVGELPQFLAQDSSVGKLYVANSDSDTVSVIKKEDNGVSKTLTVGDYPVDIRVDERAHRAYAVNVMDGTISVIDTNLDTVINTISVGAGLGKIAVDPGKHVVYVPSSGEQKVFVVNEDKKVTDFAAGAYPIGVAFNTRMHTLYVPNPVPDFRAGNAMLSVIQERISPWITSLAPPAGSVGVPYSFTVIAEGFPDPEFSFSGDLPPGLSFSQTGLLSGKPTTLGTFKFRVIASNSVAPNAVADYVLTFAAGTGRSQDPNNPGGSGGSGSGTAGSGSTAFLGSAASSNRGAGLPNTGLVFDGLWPAIAVVLLATGALTLTTQRKNRRNIFSLFSKNGGNL